MGDPAGEPADLDRWLGRVDEADDCLAVERVAALAAALDAPGPAPAAGAPLAPLRHWLFFWSLVPGAGLGDDGHPRTGGFLPPVGAARRMWAGSRVAFPGRLDLGSRVHRRSTITRVTTKAGRSGRLVFVGLRHEIGDGSSIAIVDDQDIVYREGGGGGSLPAGQPAPAAADVRRRVQPDPVLLFRYSALTFNAHRIHYDRDYATGVEGYPGLVVHGPLLATLMVDVAAGAKPERRLAAFSFRAVRPVFAGRPLEVAARATGADSLALWIADADGWLAVEGEARFA